MELNTSSMDCLKRFSIFEVGQKLQLDCDLGWGKGWRNFPSRAGSREVSHTQIGWGKSVFLNSPENLNVFLICEIF